MASVSKISMTSAAFPSHSLSMNIGNHAIDDTAVFLIAEVGANHESDILKAKEHIDAAREAGAHAVKFQSLNVSKLYKEASSHIATLHSMIDLEEHWHAELKSYAEAKGIIFCSSPTYIDAVKILSDLNVSFIKIASAQVGTFPQLIESIARTGIPAVFSTGIANYEVISKAVAIFEKNNHRHYAILHCNSQYPTPYKNVNLGMISTYKKMFGCPVGFSDHTEGTSIVLAAVARGANLIEKHFKVDDKCKSPDAPFSINPRQFSIMAREICHVKDACLNGSRVFIEDTENKFKESIKYKLIVKTKKNAGETFDANDFVYLRHHEGIDVVFEELVIKNFRASENITKNTLLKWQNLSGTD